MTPIIIRAVPERVEYVAYLRRHLPDAMWCFDKTRNAMDTFLAAMAMAGEGAAVHMEEDILLADGFDVVSAWGFEYVTCLTWAKSCHFGIGQYFRGKTEHCLFCRRGQPGYRRSPAGKREQGMTLFVWPCQGHSIKPPVIHEWAERMSPEPRLELFARKARAGWDAWGNEAPECTKVELT